ncbi:DUF6484 domain-containing protein [Pseudoduganella albidiflava]|uniref:DUF6484 domain-containing protein n=1 Tax=Pseudoduganella albidiflava TaxID=321983 RepID=A0A411WX58_9BURK|nr:DUF6484 domain-containing protein [Pseudoduganella albidiflava]QBI01286.1 hypothetical protein EYF70_10865 [Pseudoduganella albidiflava]GGY36883.1 hypothetical protein GCM10007387_19030 [Pseudoduganella albidiflava]
MDFAADPFDPIVADGGEGAQGASRPAVAGPQAPATPVPPAQMQLPVVLVRFVGFDLDDQPLVAGIAGLPGHVVRARSTVPLRRLEVGAEVVAVLEGGLPERPLILGVIQHERGAEPAPAAEPGNVAWCDGERVEIRAEREVVLRCGDASITLTRAGKVIIKGNYIVSRSTGCNKIKGAAVDIN